MNALIIDQEPVTRLVAFLGIFLFMAVWEAFLPRRVPSTLKSLRWFNNLSLTFLNALVGRFLFPLSAFGLAISSQMHGWGILNLFGIPPLVAGVVSIGILDLVIYTQHLIFHKVRILWPIHGTHHTDLDIDVTTGTRFHPIEIVLSLLIKMGTITLIGIPAWSFLLFEILLNSTSMFNHGNIGINTRVDRFLRFILVTPDMHRVHHSVIIGEHNSNYGFSFSCWDRLFGTYKDQPEAGHLKMVIGLANFRDPNSLSFLRLLTLPFAKRKMF